MAHRRVLAASQAFRFLNEFDLARSCTLASREFYQMLADDRLINDRRRDTLQTLEGLAVVAGGPRPKVRGRRNVLSGPAMVCVADRGPIFGGKCCCSGAVVRRPPAIEDVSDAKTPDAKIYRSHRTPCPALTHAQLCPSSKHNDPV